jgi:hypothetical protein
MEDLGIDRKFLNASQVKPLASVVGSYTYFADGDVLLAKITPCFENGKLGIAAGLSNGIGFGSSEFIVFRPSSDLDKEFLYYFLARPEFRTEGATRMGGQLGSSECPRSSLRVVGFRSHRSPIRSGSSPSWTKRLTASPPQKPTPKRTSETLAPSSKVIFNPFSHSVARGGWKRR